MDPKLLDYIKSVRKKGFDEKTIKDHLHKYGYTKTDVDSAFNELAPVLAEIKPPEEEKPKKSFPKVPIFIVIIIVAVLIGAYFFIQKDSLECENVSIGIYLIEDEPVLCVFPDNTKLQMILENQGNEVISAVEIEIKGERKKVTEKLDNLNLIPGQIHTKTLEYSPDYGDIKEISIIPVSATKCNAITITDIKTC